MTLFTSQTHFGRSSLTWAAASLLLFGALGCGPEIPEADNAARTSSKSTQITESSTPPPASSTAAQTSSSDGVLSAIQGTYIATLQKVVNGSTQTQPFTFTIGQREWEGVTWPTLEVTSSGAIGTIEFGSFLTWELYAYGTTYALISPAMTQESLSEDYTLAFELLLTIQSQSSSSKLLVPTQSVILIKDCGFFESVFASCSNRLNGASFVENSFQKL